jgi:SAM-dependent methyltransferase
VKVIGTITELDAKIAECDAAEAISDSAMRALFGGFRMDPPADLPADPFAPEYRERQLALYREIVGEPYSTEKEATRFDVDAALRRPFPFTTQSSATAGEYFMAIGYALHVMALAPGSRVLEFGPGWGFTSLWLAQLGHRVTVVDVEPCFCELIRRRAEHEGVSIEVVNADFFWAEDQAREFDAVLFYDCFHHCDDHLRLLRGLRRVVTPDGRLFFGAEPIVPDLPMPWGLRLDGWALWGIRKNGWMELGFRDDYFARALMRCGWFGRKVAIAGTDRLRVWEARRLESARFRFAADDSRLQTEIGSRGPEGLVIDGTRGGVGLYGPYLDLPPGRYRARFNLRPDAPLRGVAEIDVVCDTGRTRLAQGRIRAPRWLGAREVPELTFEADRHLSGVELRLFCEPGFVATVESIEIAPVAAEFDPSSPGSP